MEPDTPTAPNWVRGAPLTPFEESIRDALPSGMPVIVEGDTTSDAMRAWGEDRSIRAEVLRHVLTDPGQEIDPRGLQLHGVRIVGEVDAAWATIRVPLSLSSCYFDSEAPLDLSHVTVPRLALFHCDLPAVNADGLVASKGVSLTDSIVRGWLRLARAQIGRELALADSTIHGADADGDAVVLDGIVVDGSMFLDGTIAHGAVRLVGAQVAGPLHGGEARILSVDRRGNAMSADGVSVGGNVFLRGLKAAGTIRLIGSQMAQLNCAAASVGHGATGLSVLVDSATIRGDVFLDRGFTASGTVSVQNTTVHGFLTFEGASLNGKAVAVTTAGTHVNAVLYWDPAGEVRGKVVLERMTVGRIEDRWTPDLDGWPRAGNLRLAGLTYDELGGTDVGVERRLAWLRRQYGTGDDTPFSLQPYEQLIRMYRAAGQDTDARTVAIAKANDLRRYGDLTPWRRLGSWLLNVTVRHGYKPGRALVFLVLLYVTVVATFAVAQHQPGTMVPARQAPSPLPADAAEHCRAGYPCFYPSTYALDLLVPIIEIRDADAWRPNGHRPWGGALVAWSVLASLLGWASSTLAVLGFTGVVRKE